MDLKEVLMTGALFGALVSGSVSCSPQTPEAYLRPNPPDEKVVQENTEVFDPTVDILFVIDNSGSMSAHQRNLATNVDKFTSTFINSSILDYNIGVVTTDMDGTSYGSGGRCCGKLVGYVRVVTKATQNADMVLSENLLSPGTGGSAEEKSFDPVAAALTPPLINGFNAGFYRPDASLVVIFLTDAEDQSRDTDAKGLYELLLKLKGGNADRILAYGVIVPSNDTLNCRRDDGGARPRRIEDFLSRVVNKNNNIMNICDPDYGVRLAGMAQDIVKRIGNVIYLNRPPDLKSIRVTYGTQTLPMDYEKGWSFDAKKNAVILGAKIPWGSQPTGSRVKVFYNAAVLPPASP